MRQILLGLVACSLLAGCAQSGGDELLVFAAASLADALGEIEELFEEQSQTVLVVSYGGSQMLAQQIARGAPADVFISAGRFPVELLVDGGKIEPPVSNLLANSLVVAVRSDAGFRLDSMADLTGPAVRRIAMADPRLAPAGRYARESLEGLGIWNDIESKLVLGPDIRATLAYVESGNADAAIVYATDARGARSIEVMDIVPPQSYSPIRYPVAVIARSGSRTPGVDDFIAFLRGDGAREVFRRHGFEPAE